MGWGVGAGGGRGRVADLPGGWEGDHTACTFYRVALLLVIKYKFHPDPGRLYSTVGLVWAAVNI